MEKPMKNLILPTLFATLLTHGALAHDIKSPANTEVTPTFDISSAKATTDGRLTTFAMELVGTAGTSKPVAIGQLKGAKVQSYVWPTNLDPARVGFDEKSGILALAVTAHPDFDDTPLYDENGDGDPANDGADWHSHWVVLVKDENCGAGLKVRDVSPGVDLLPANAPGLPLALSSPGVSPLLNEKSLRVITSIGNTQDTTFDAVTAELQVNLNGAAPLLCVSAVHDIASGDLSLPGKIM
jgi:hypothetical protein